MTSTPEFSQPAAALQRCLRKLALRAARAGGFVAHKMFASELSVEFKPDGSEVSQADHAAQAAVIACIRRHRPGDAFLAEETIAPARVSASGRRKSRTQSSGGAAKSRPRQAPAEPSATVVWSIDPIDGTRNYVRRIPLFCSSVAAMIDGVPVAGAIYVPMLREMYSASLAEGAFLNRRTVHTLDGEQRLLIVAIPSKQQRNRDTLVHTWLDRLVIRNLGSTALHFAMVAAGQLDAALANDAKLWDIAAGWTLVTAAGGRFTSPDGEPVFPRDPLAYRGQEIPCIAAGPKTHARLISR